MGEGTTPSGWRDIDRRHRAGILLGAAVVLVTVVVGAVALTGGEPPAPGGETSRTITPAEQTTEAVVPTPSYEQTATTDVEASGGVDADAAAGGGSAASGGAGEPTPGSEPPVASTRILYRRDGWLCVASLDGTAEQRVASSESGVFSLSPDGGTIASVDADGQLRLYAVATGSVVEIGPAERDRPAWAPGSAWLVFTAPGQRVTRVERNGASGRVLFSGRLPVVASDGATVLAAAPTTQEPAVLVWREGETERFGTTAPITGLACSATRIYLGFGPDAKGTSTLRSMLLDGTGGRIEARSQNVARGVSIGSPLVSPDADWVAYAEQGDDGYSRVFAVPVRGGVPVQVSGRRDSYVLQWSGTGNALVLAEGNPTQGEPLSIVSATVPGGVRRLIVERAGG